jgi:hypothetical protein
MALVLWWRRLRSTHYAQLDLHSHEPVTRYSGLTVRVTAPWSLRLLVAFGRVPIQRVFKFSRGRRSFELAGQNLTIGCVVSVEFTIGIPIRPKRRAGQRDACENPVRTGIRQHFRLQLRVRPSARVAANGAGRYGCISAQREFIG